MREEKSRLPHARHGGSARAFMGSLAVSKPFPFCVLIFSFFFLTFLASSLDVDDRDGDYVVISRSHNAAAVPSPPPPPPPPPPPRNISPFKPSVAVIVGVLTTMFSITFLLLLYAKHCKRGGGGYPGADDAAVASSSAAAARKNSGIDRSVIESLPVFRFGSLRGQKDGLECAVCLTRFDPAEVLRLLPKCKHAFHVECVDTWLDAHSTCPLCRYRVDPEDVLLVGDPNASLDSPAARRDAAEDDEEDKHSVVVDAGDDDPLETRRVSGRHSDGERTGRQKWHGGDAAALRRSVDSARGARKKTEAVSVGCFDRGPRKDALLLPEDEDGTAAAIDRRASAAAEERRRLEHRIIVSGKQGHQRWSDVQPSDLLYLRSEMIISDGRGFPSGEGGRSVINGRSVSEITGVSRFGNNGIHGSHERPRRRQMETDTATGLVSRWLAWISQSPAVRSEGP
ncbi:RING-H2 finger protein ATL43 [Syzygium oleosum]|uniref:RING-H2 finger protein ATL43 n=1 Tax=Syzygium oleosum TaxID=219896 RepID=UPI0011D218AC|nr:RING-H2 finger protein ATL43 [Syzygium oleosum]